MMIDAPAKPAKILPSEVMKWCLNARQAVMDRDAYIGHQDGVHWNHIETIKQLRSENARYAGCKRSLERVIVENTAKADEIERLRTDRDWWAETAKEYKNDYNEVIRTGRCASGYHITPKMTDAAVEYCEERPHSEHTRWGVLNKLNIFRCAGCGGTGVVDVMEPGAFLKHNEDCPACTIPGHGWTIGGEDE